MGLRIYTFAWGNNDKRASLKDRDCIVLARGKMNSCLVQFRDSGQREIVSQRALRQSGFTASWTPQPCSICGGKGCAYCRGSGP